jgi:alkanesulfonate monooxygenase SsuD/methylene tetrahydromethanopterin reductase-like flavin-dependent oxidoreductase (luciferase family)
VRFGLYLPNQADFADVSVLAALARQAESAGWDGVFIWDELVPVYGYATGNADGDDQRNESWQAADVIVALTAIAAATETIRFGALVTPVSRLRPEVFAHQTATLDQYSGGRLVIGVGLGNPDSQFSAFGHATDPRVRAAQVDEFLATVTALWSGKVVDVRGEYFSATDIALRPTPVQQPRIPVWIGADSGHRTPRRRAARWDGFAPASTEWPNGIISVADCEAMTADIRLHRTSADPFDLVLIGDAAGHRPSTSEIPAYAAAGVTWTVMQALTLDAASARIAAGPPQLD